MVLGQGPYLSPGLVGCNFWSSLGCHRNVWGREQSRGLGQENQYWLQDRLQSPAGELGMALGGGCLGRGHRAECSGCVLPRVLSPEPARFTLCDRHTAQCWCPAGGTPGDRLPLSTQCLPRSCCLWSAHQITHPNGPLLSDPRGATGAHHCPLSAPAA